MSFLTKRNISLTQLIETDDSYYQQIKNQCLANNQKAIIFKILDHCRAIITNNDNGSNVLRYLLYHMNNRILTHQYKKESNFSLSNLYLHYGCIPFDQMPFCSSLRQHNPKLQDLLLSIPTENREHEFLARIIQNNTESRGILFTHQNELKNFQNVQNLITQYNNKLYYKHINRRIETINQYLYIKQYVLHCKEIVKTLLTLSAQNVPNYSTAVESWLQNDSYQIDDEFKKIILKKLFSKSRVALIIGAAGTGKTTLVKHLTNFLSNNKILVLTHTHTALNNLQQQIINSNCTFNTISSQLHSKNTDYELIICDECSTISNENMARLLEKFPTQAFLLVGDPHQIEAIQFGNWFKIAIEILPRHAIFELQTPYRTTNQQLMSFWKAVRNFQNNLSELLTQNAYSSVLNDSIFHKFENNEIILCLNYGGLYGINNINQFLQKQNPNPEFFWDGSIYKVGDPILFNDIATSRFGAILCNNTKGRIFRIQKDQNKIRFYIELEKQLTGLDIYHGFTFEKDLSHNKSIVSFDVNQCSNTDQDDIDETMIVPFQVTYALSIHRAQGLEYNSVKIVIQNFQEEKVTHNIFYTAITRARKNLKIYWSPEVEHKVLNSFTKPSQKDINIFRSTFLKK